MKLNWFDRVLIALATVFLGVIAVRPLFTPGVAHAQSSSGHYYIEPGIKVLVSPDRTKQLQGKVVVDLTNGNIWGFPTSQDVPYPMDMVKTTPPTSSPMYLGRFDFSAMHHGE